MRTTELTTSEHDGQVVDDAIWQQIVVDKTDPVSPYRQIANSIRHRIATNRLNPGAELPSVRSLAVQVGVNPATVARAYRQLQSDGLVETHLGVGTIVRDTKHLLYNARRGSFEDLEREVDRALTPLLQMGYGPADVKRAVDRRLSVTLREQRVVVVTESSRAHQKYLKLMREELNPLGVDVQAARLADIEGNSEVALEHLRNCTRVLTSLGLLRRVEDTLALHGLGPPVSIIFTELSLGTIEALSSVPEGSRTLVVSEERYRNSVLGILLQHIPKENVEVLHVLEADPLRSALERCKVVVHSLSMSDLVADHVSDDHRVILMDYQIRPDALAKLKESFITPPIRPD